MSLKKIPLLCTALALCIVSLGCSKAVETVATTEPTTTTTTTTTTTVTTTTTTAAANRATGTKTTAAAVAYKELDPTYERLLLVNADHPLPSDFDNSRALVTIDKQYLNGSLNQIDGGIYPYLCALLNDAKSQGVTLYVRSPYRSYATQKYLFNNKVNNLITAGTPENQAEAAAALAVARPGTSEHQTGLAIDFNVASSTFEKSPGFAWMKKNAENYGFILRYPSGKTAITGIMYEAWHWRFVGINAAKEINRLGVTLEEYLELKNEQ